MNNYLEELEEISKKRNDSGLIHYGIVHYIQNKATENGFDGFILKAAIYSVLENIPKVFPKDFPEIIEKDPDFKPTKEMNRVFRKLNKDLIIPISGYEIINIIKWAREYENFKK